MNNDNRDVMCMNDDIQSPKVRIVNSDTPYPDVMSIQAARGLAYQGNTDLVEISVQGDVSICRLIDIGQFRYEQKRKERESRRNNKPVVTKELTFRPNIDTHDFDLKIAQAKRFLSQGHKVKISLRFRGREITHQDIGMSVLTRFRTSLEESVRVEREPALDGRQAMMILAPKG